MVDPFSLSGIVLAIASGALGKAGENSFDQLFNVIKSALGGTITGNALEAGTEIDQEQVVIDVEAVTADSDKFQELKAQIKELLDSNQRLKEQIEAITKQPPQIINKKVQGINNEKDSNVTINNPIFNIHNEH